MTILGGASKGGSAFTLDADAMLLARFQLRNPRKPAKITAYIDGYGGGGLQQVARAVAIAEGGDAPGKVMAASDEIVQTEFTGPNWRDFLLDEAGPEWPPGMYLIGLHGGPPGGVIRLRGETPEGRGGVTVVDSYAGGPSDPVPFGGMAPTLASFSVFVTMFPAWKPPEGAPEFTYARLPFPEAQAKLIETGPSSRLVRRAECTWHGTWLDPEEESFCVVKVGGPLADLVGERLLITRHDGRINRSVVALCEGDANIDFDLSLTRRLFLALGLPALDSILVRVTVLA